MTATRAVVDRLAAETDLTDRDRADLADFLTAVERHAADRAVPLDDDRRLALAAHALAFVRRVRGGEQLPPLDTALYREVPDERLTAVRALVDRYCAPRGHYAHDPEVLLLALHLEAAAHAAAAPDPDAPEPSASEPSASASEEKSS